MNLKFYVSNVGSSNKGKQRVEFSNLEANVLRPIHVM